MPEKRPRAYKLLSGLSHSDMELIKTLPYFNRGNRNRTGLTFEQYMKRFNPYGNMARRSIGGVGETSESKQIHGISGLEKALDSLLYGRAGTARKVALTKKITDSPLVPAVPGCDIVTTIDINMQDIVENEPQQRARQLRGRVGCGRAHGCKDRRYKSHIQSRASIRMARAISRPETAP